MTWKQILLEGDAAVLSDTAPPDVDSVLLVPGALVLELEGGRFHLDLERRPTAEERVVHVALVGEVEAPAALEPEGVAGEVQHQPVADVDTHGLSARELDGALPSFAAPAGREVARG